MIMQAWPCSCFVREIFWIDHFLFSWHIFQQAQKHFGFHWRHQNKAERSPCTWTNYLPQNFVCCLRFSGVIPTYFLSLWFSVCLHVAGETACRSPSSLAWEILFERAGTCRKITKSRDQGLQVPSGNFLVNQLLKWLFGLKFKLTWS